MRWVQKTGEKLFRLNFSADRSSRISQVFRLDPPVGKLSRKKSSRKALFRLCKAILIQSNLSVENGCFRLKPNSSFPIRRKKAFWTQLFSTQVFQLGDPVEKLDLFDWICQPKNSVEKVFHLFLNPSHRSSHHKTHTHTRYHTAVSYNSADAALAITAVASRRKSAWCTPSSARQQRVLHDSSSARCRRHFANNGYACCSFGGSRLSATPRTWLWRLSAKPRATNPLGRRFVAH